MSVEMAGSLHQSRPLPTVSVIVCCHTSERADDVCRVVESVLGQTHPPCQTLVSVDHNEQLHQTLQGRLPDSVTLVLNTGAAGLSGSRNFALKYVTGEVVAFIDDDAVAAEDWLYWLACHYNDNNVIGVGGRTIPVWESGRPFWFPEELDWTIGGTHKGTRETAGPVRNLWGGNMSFRKDVFDTVGMFSLQLGRSGSSGQGEDTEFCMRIAATIPDATMLHEPAAVVYHKVPRQRGTLRYLARRSFDGGLSLATLKGGRRPQAQGPASPEKTYFRYLMTTSLRERARRFYKPGSSSQVLAIGLAVAAWGTGYVSGLLTRGSSRKD